ncbi:Peroxisomal hydratase-dehydrogenase-epimerase [Taphrina deformans PYCC 5710]|uniref:Peroxisomal hydratase-dehydrogenase-epimerase n=1 Tax=Taphrina deformans (strain PYCC 5710 / ATCC 11124 / CBS 356.35 / IMI 108563 / JCM 9778 / NBRC 8474) TaxID=1097556 RepID=R4X6U7_TAPDE|nr:Peroxisomal hydratase-dehydrogenase-epimerase [Taphrina deformans PYCC 5710]|eukprot:CCG80937.1 Peroxisomal hydratase-dehydrogenase-epimerase [Taphrina deformans PYCC 5710]
MSDIRFDNKTVIVTGAGGGLGKAYSLFFGSRGANVVVNDLGGSARGQGADSRAADIVVNEITKAGGKAVANYNSVEDGDKIVETALKAFGSVHILINNAGILRDVSFKNMKDEDWDLIYKVHTYGAYKCARACWPVFRKQGFGRIINTASAAGLYGNFGQTNYSAQKLGMVAFSGTLAKEGQKYNILANTIAPIAASRMTATIMGEEQLKLVTPDFVVPTVAFLVSEQTENTGGVYELGGGFVSKLRWQRAGGALLKTDASLTPSAILAKWDDVNNFDEATYPESVMDMDYPGVLEAGSKIPSNVQGEDISFKNKVVVITGAGGGLGRAYALQFAKLGAKLVINDVGNPDGVIAEVKKLGAEAVGDKHSVEDGDAVIKTAIDAFGAVHVLINNAGILRDKSFSAMTDEQWQIIHAVHVRGTYKVTKAAWPYFLKQKEGRVVNTASAAGLYSNFGQANYATAKMAILGLSQALAREGEKYNILTNCIAPNAGTNMTRTIMPEEMVQAMSPDFVAPLVALLASDKAPANGHVFETGCGWIGRVRWQRTAGHGFPVDVKMTPEHIREHWSDIIDFEKDEPTNPESGSEAIMAIMANSENKANGEAGDDATEESPLAAVQKVLTEKFEEFKYNYTERDVVLYNLGIGAKHSELPFVYENNEDFEVIPTFGVIPQFESQMAIPYDEFLPNFSPMMLLHGEQYLEIKKFPIPTSGALTAQARVIEVLDKGKAASVVLQTVTKDENGEELFLNEGTIFIRGSGGYGGESKGKDRGAATSANKIPARKPDSVVEEKTTEDQAALYRLSGDYNPLHIDPAFAAVGKFPKPILHGLCFFGFSGKHVYKTYGMFKNIKVRFVGSVYPGETLRTEMWKEGNKIIFQTKVVERDVVCIAAAAAELQSKVEPKL